MYDMTRFDFNMYSFDSEWTMGAEWWMRRKTPEIDVSRATGAIGPLGTLLTATAPNPVPGDSGVQGVVKARVSTNTVHYLTIECSLILTSLSSRKYR
jgi:distribution and morphology protein 10